MSGTTNTRADKHELKPAPIAETEKLLGGLYGDRRFTVYCGLVRDQDRLWPQVTSTAKNFPAGEFWLRSWAVSPDASFVALKRDQARLDDWQSLELPPSYVLAVHYALVERPSGVDEMKTCTVWYLFKLPPQTDAQLLFQGFGALGRSVNKLIPAPGTRGCRLLGGDGSIWSISLLREFFPAECSY